MFLGKAACILCVVGVAGVLGSSTSARRIPEAGAVADEHPPRRVHMRGEVMRKKLKHSVEPAYPPLARKQGVEGTVKLRIIVGVGGAVRQVKVLSGPPLLTMAAVDAVRLWERSEERRVGKECRS